MSRIAVLGAGPAGSTFALQLIARGVDPGDIVLFDRAQFPRPKLCGGAVTARGTELLGELLETPPICHVVPSGLEFAGGGEPYRVVESGPQWVYDRAEFDHALVKACVGRGVALREQTTVKHLEPAHGGWKVETSRGAQTFRWIIGADGARGISRRAAELPEGRIGRLIEAVYEGDGDSGLLRFDFDPILDGIPGYAWVFPDPSGAARRFKIGVMDGRGTVSGEQLRSYLESYASRRGFRLAGSKVQGWPERFYDWGTRGSRPGLLLIGEALGIDALLGEGIAPALYSARYAAERLKRALDSSSRQIQGYERGFAWTDEGYNLVFQARLADRLYGPRPFRWLRTLFEMDELRELAASGSAAYGRLARYSPYLSARFALRSLSRGLPSVAPMRRSVSPSAPS